MDPGVCAPGGHLAGACRHGSATATLTYNGTALNPTTSLPPLYDLTIVEADRLVELDEIAPENITTPGIFVNMVLDKNR